MPYVRKILYLECACLHQTLTLFILMDNLINIDTISLELTILQLKRLPFKISMK